MSHSLLLKLFNKAESYRETYMLGGILGPKYFMYKRLMPRGRQKDPVSLVLKEQIHTGTAGFSSTAKELGNVAVSVFCGNKT